jgi:hypothetical protein
MRYAIRRLPALLMGIFFITAAAGAADKSVDRIMTLSGIDKQIAALPGAIKMGFLRGAKQSAAIPDAELKKMMESADKTLKPSVVLAAVRAQLQDSLTGKDTAALLAWYESGIGQKITAVEEKASTAEGNRQIMKHAQELLGNKKRAAAAQRLDKLLGATDKMLDLQENLMLATYRSLSKAIAPDKPFDTDAFKAKMAELEPKMRQNIHVYVLASLIYTYLPISDDALAQYEQFLATPAAKKFNDASIQGIDSGLQQIISDWSYDIGTIMKQKHDAAEPITKSTTI